MDILVDRRLIWIFVAVGSTVGGLMPEAWGGSALGCLGGLAGLWFAVRLT
jgi:hypothetical protein